MQLKLTTFIFMLLIQQLKNMKTSIRKAIFLIN